VSAHAPENTVSAFGRAIADRADGVELDVRDAACGTVVVAHDPTLDRVAGREGTVAALTAAELARIPVADAGHPDGVSGFPTLDAAIDQVVGAGLRLNVELKGDVPDRIRLARLVARLLARRRPSERDAILISSFRPEMLAAARALGAGVPIAFLFDAENTGELRAAALWRALRPDGLHPQHRLATRPAIARWKRRGLFVTVWTVEDEARIRILAHDGVDGIITNDPARARRALGPPDAP
jgi:glycerophosphoryl diester phosphodiesterase